MKSKHIFVMIAMCGLAAASIGVTINCGGVFYAPVAEDLGVGRGNVAMMVTITSIMASIIAMGIPKLLTEKTLKPIIIIAVALLAGATYAISLCGNLTLIYILSVVRGIGDGMINFVMITMIVNYWFYAKRGVFTSIVMAFSGVPGVLLSPVFTSVINTSGWRTAFVWAAAFTLLFCLPAILLPFSIRPEASGIKPYGYDEFMAARKEGRTMVISDSSARFNFFNPKFLLALIICICISIVAAVPQHMPGYAVSIGKSASVGAMMLSVSMAFNIGSKLLFGVMNDRIGSYKTIYVMAFINIAGILLLLFVPTDLGLYAGAGLFAFAYAIAAVGMAMLAGYLFGMELYASAYPVISFVGGIANALGVTFVGSLYDITGTYTVNFWLALACQIVLILSLMAAVAIRRKERHTGIESE